MTEAKVSERARKEIAHGRKLAQGHAEETWGWSTTAGQLRAQRRGALIADGAALRPGVRVLEIGCGTGVFTAMFAKSGAHILAVDISHELLNQARQRHLADTQVHFLEERFEDCLVHGPFAAVIGSSVLHHLEIEPALRKIYDLLEPGGILSFAEPNMLNPQIMLTKNISWLKQRLGDSEDETAFVRWRLRRQLACTGFQDIRVTPFDWLHPWTPPLLIPLVRSMGRALESLPLVCEFAGSLLIAARKPTTAADEALVLPPLAS